jgi:hypothetical protein
MNRDDGPNRACVAEVDAAVAAVAQLALWGSSFEVAPHEGRPEGVLAIEGHQAGLGLVRRLQKRLAA